MIDNFIIFYLIVVNIITFFVFAIDKKRAVRNKWRIPEKTLMGLAVIGGSVGALAGMTMFRHKTRKLMFRFGIPIILIFQIAVILLGTK